MHRVAQAVGEAVNASRGAISEMKAQIEQVRLERAMQGKDSSTHDEDDPAEMRLKQQIDAHKTEYKVYLHLSLLPSLPSTWIQRGLSASSGQTSFPETSWMWTKPLHLSASPHSARPSKAKHDNG